MGRSLEELKKYDEIKLMSYDIVDFKGTAGVVVNFMARRERFRLNSFQQ